MPRWFSIVRGLPIQAIHRRELADSGCRVLGLISLDLFHPGASGVAVDIVDQPLFLAGTCNALVAGRAFATNSRSRFAQLVLVVASSANTCWILLRHLVYDGMQRV